MAEQIEASFSKALQDAPEIGAGKMQRKQIGSAGARTTEETKLKGNFPAFPVGHGTGEKAACQSDKREDSDDES